MDSLAAGDDDFRIAVEQRLVAQRHRAQARTAQLIDAPGGAFHRDAGGDRGLTGRVLALRRGQDLPHDHLGNPCRLDARALQRSLDGDGAEIVGRRGGERTVETSDRGAGGADDDGHRLTWTSPRFGFLGLDSWAWILGPEALRLGRRAAGWAGQSVVPSC